MKNWDYSILTHNASKHGGPVKYIDLLTSITRQETAHTTNVKWLKGTVPAFLLLTPLAIKGAISIGQENIPKLKKHFKQDTSANEKSEP